jgi:hypothetical protein
MQIFVKPATPGSTLVYTCSEQTILEEFLQWVEDKTALPERFYYITYNGHYLPKYTEEQKKSTFGELGIKKESTLTLNGRLCVKPSAQKLNATA